MKILAAQKDETSQNKRTSTCRKTRREAEGLHDELKDKRKKKLVVIIHKHRNGEVYPEACLRPEAMHRAGDQVPRDCHMPYTNPKIISPKPSPITHTGAKTELKTQNHHPDYPVTVNKTTVTDL